ncbi:hypothetical protein SIIN_6441_T, partial [Serendipita indica DSM 11827]
MPVPDLSELCAILGVIVLSALHNKPVPVLTLDASLRASEHSMI